MPSLRMFALAGAILLIIPVGVIADPKSDVYEAEATVEAQVSNINLLQPAVNGSPLNVGVMPEQVVEGHTTFVTIQAKVNGTEVQGNVTVDGFVNCQYHGEATTSGGFFVLGVFVPYVTGVKDVNAECHVGDRVIITPTVYCTVTGDFQCGANSSSFPLMRPTGNFYDFTTPNGEYSYIEEYAFEITRQDEWGTTTDTYYAWAVPVMHPWLDENGHVQNMRAPLPWDHIDAMPRGTDHYSVLYEDKVNKEE